MLHFISSEELRNLLATSSTATTVIQFASGILIVINYFKKKSTGEVKFSTLTSDSVKFLIPFFRLRRQHFPSLVDFCHAVYGYATAF